MFFSARWPFSGHFCVIAGSDRKRNRTEETFCFLAVSLGSTGKKYRVFISKRVSDILVQAIAQQKQTCVLFLCVSQTVRRRRRIVRNRFSVALAIFETPIFLKRKECTKEVQYKWGLSCLGFFPKEGSFPFRLLPPDADRSFQVVRGNEHR